MRILPLVLASMAILSLGCSDSTGPSEANLQPTPPPETIRFEIAPALATLQSGETIQLTARLSSAAALSIGPATIAWSSSSEQVATVSPTGMVSAHSGGEAVIQAVSGVYRATARVTVVGPMKKHDGEVVCMKRLPDSERHLNSQC
jgi:hypothetical protein